VICFGKQIPLPVEGVVSDCTNKDYVENLIFLHFEKVAYS